MFICSSKKCGRIRMTEKREHNRIALFSLLFTILFCNLTLQS